MLCAVDIRQGILGGYPSRAVLEYGRVVTPYRAVFRAMKPGTECGTARGMEKGTEHSRARPRLSIRLGFTDEGSLWNSNAAVEDVRGATPLKILLRSSLSTPF